MAHSLDDVPGAGLTLGAYHGRAFGYPPESLPEVGGTADERHPEGPFVDVVLLIGGGEHLGLVDEVDLEGLEHLGFDEVTDAALRHDRDCDGVLNGADDLWIGHPGNPARRADIGGNPFEGHHSDRARLLRDRGLLGGHHVHDDSALEHLGVSQLDLESTFVPDVHCIPFSLRRPNSRSPDATQALSRSRRRSSRSEARDESGCVVIEYAAVRSEKPERYLPQLHR